MRLRRAPHPRRQFRRREGLDDIVDRALLQRLGDCFVPAVGGDEDDRSIGDLRNSLHDLDAVGAGEYQVEQDQVGLLRLDDPGQLVVVAGQCAGAVHHLLQDGIDVKTSADAQDRRTQL